MKRDVSEIAQIKVDKDVKEAHWILEDKNLNKAFFELVRGGYEAKNMVFPYNY